MAGDAHEIELKLRLPRREIAALARHPLVRALKRSRARTETLSGTYFDSEDWRLAREGIALRIRRAGRRWVQTVKGPATDEAGGGLASRAEYEWPLRAGDRAPPLDFAALGGTPFARAIARAAGRSGFGARFVTLVQRTTIPLAFPDGTRALLCLDVGQVRGAAPRRPRAALCEVEIELESGTPLRLFELALALTDDFDLVVEARSKAERGHALVTGTPPRPAVAEDVRQDEDADAAGAIAAIVRNCLRQIGANADGLLADDDPEWIHQMRVGVRRLRSCFAIARRHLPPAAAGHLEDDLRWLAGALGPARDLDVFIIETLPAMRDASARAAADADAAGRALAPLEAHARLRQAAARSDARAAVASKRFARLLLAGAALAAAPRLGAPDGSPEAMALAAPAKVFAAKVLARRHRKFARGLASLPRMAPAERHRMRILAKRLRYATEYFAPLFPARRARVYRKSLADLQAELGRLNDATVAAALAAELGGPASPGAAMFAGWAAAQDERAANALDRARRAFADARPFWK
jgi:inorganic triphosphatase YgiF